MKSKRLAQWLQDHIKTLGATNNKQDNTLYVALYEGIIDMALTGDIRMVDSVAESAASHSVATGRKLTDLLGVHQYLRQRIWNRIGEEVDPEPAFVMLSALDDIFVHIIRVTIDAYTQSTQMALAAKSAEISRLYAESEEKMMQYATEVSRTNRELARLEKAKTDFISIAAHELKTPLTLIQGYVGILQDMEIEEQGKKLTEGIDRGVQRIDSILEDMLDLSAMDMRKLHLTLQQVNLKKSIHLVVTQSHHALNERKHTVTTQGLDTLPNIEADITRIHQVFKQLVSNAIKYTPDGGCISIVGQKTTTAATTVKISISDTGVGIAPEDKEKIFEKFYRPSDSALHSTGKTKFMGAGPGLGLAIVKGLVEAHGGNVTAESPGFDMQNYPGSKFVVQLPIEATPAPDIEIQWLRPKPANDGR